MKRDGLILVSGLARCGTSLLMQMLAAGGWAVFDPDVSTWPAFEHPANMGEAATTIPASASGVLKWLDPQRVPPPRKVRGSIFLARDSEQQARSFVKFLAAVGVPSRGADLAAMAASLERDEPLALAELSKSGPVLRLTFEKLIADPRALLASIVDWKNEPLDIDAAVSQVRARSTGAACLPYMLESQLLGELEARS